MMGIFSLLADKQRVTDALVGYGARHFYRVANPEISILYESPWDEISRVLNGDDDHVTLLAGVGKRVQEVMDELNTTFRFDWTMVEQTVKAVIPHMNLLLLTRELVNGTLSTERRMELVSAVKALSSGNKDSKAGSAISGAMTLLSTVASQGSLGLTHPELDGHVLEQNT